MHDAAPGPLVLVGFDDSPAGRAALATAADLAGRMSGRLEVLHAVPPVTPMAAPSGLMGDGFAVPPPADAEQQRAATASALSTVVGGVLAGCTVPWTFEVVDGDAVTVLEEHAADAYLVVVGTRHAGIGTALDRLLTGSTSRALQKRCPRPVLVVPEPHHH
ncbi:MAG TPA: universal stress protein [Mycobacteriales bacterium]|nr:universal stress protein [Mycobacteriales bacterium]